MRGTAPSVRAISPFVVGRVQLQDAGAPQRAVRVLGVDLLQWALPDDDEQVRDAAYADVAGADHDTVVSGEAAWVDPSVGLAPGQRLAQGSVSLVIRGQPAFGAPVLLVDVGTAQRMLKLQSAEIHGAFVRVAPSGWRRWLHILDPLLPGLRGGLPEATLAVGPFRLVPVSRAQAEAALARSVLFNLAALATLALAVAWLLVHQMAAAAWLQQVLLTRRLLQMGVSGYERGVHFVAAFALFGTVASATGLGLGVLLAKILLQMSEGARMDLDGLTPNVDGFAVAKALFTGTVLSGLVAAAVAARGVRDVAAVRPLRRSRVRKVAGATAVVIAAGMAVIGGVERSGVAGGFLLVFLIAVASALLVGPVAAVVSRRFAVGAWWMRLGIRTAMADGGFRVAAGALVLAMSTALAVTLMVGSFRTDFDRMLTQRLVDDLYFSWPEWSVLDTRTLASGLSGYPGVRARASGTGIHLFGGAEVEVSVVAMDANVAARYGLGRIPGDYDVLISEQFSRRLKLVAGDDLDAYGVPGASVQDVFPAYGEARPRMIVSARVAEALEIDAVWTRLAVSGLARADLLKRLGAVAEDAFVVDRQGLRERAEATFERTFAVTRALAVLALVVAAVAMYNALVADRLRAVSRDRVLAALGVSSGELRAVAWVQGGFVAVVAGALSVPAGLAMGWVLCRVINPRAFAWSIPLEPHWTDIALSMGVGFGAAAMALLIPLPRQQIHGAEDGS